MSGNQTGARPPKRLFDRKVEAGGPATVTAVSSRISSLLVLVLTLLILIGHMCELPMGAAVAHEGEHDSSDHHADENEVACDAVLGVQPDTHARSNTAFDVYIQSHPVVPTVPRDVVSATVRESNTVARRPPLFVLHAALLI